MTDGSSATRVAVVRIMAEPVFCVNHQTRANWTKDEPSSEKAWPVQIRKKVRFQLEVMTGCSLNENLHVFAILFIIDIHNLADLAAVQDAHQFLGVNILNFRREAHAHLETGLHHTERQP